MSNTNNTMQTQTSNTLHNAIMEAGGKINPPYKYKWADKDVPVTEGIDNDIYSTVDACPNACKMWKAKSQELKTVSYHKLYDILKQHQNEVNEIRAERLARTANPLALVAQQQPVYHPQNHPTHYTQNSSTRSQQAATRNRGKTIINSPPPIYDQEPSMVAKDDEMSKDKEIDKRMALNSLSFKKTYKPTNNNLRTSSNNRIDNDIYSTVNACPNACEMWKAIERLKQGESINVQDLETNLYWEFEKFTSRDGESLNRITQEWQRFVILVKQNQELKTVSYHKLYDILKQDQNEVNELRAERLARTANPLALVSQQQPVYNPQNHPTHYTQNSSTRSQQAATRNRGKAIVNSPPPIYNQEPSMVAEDDEMSKDKETDKLMDLISLSFKKIYKPTNNNLRTSSNTSRANQDNSPRISRGTRECQKPKRAKDATYRKEKMLLCKQEEAGFQLSAEQADWRDDTDDESKDQDLEAHYMYMAQIQENDDDDDLSNERDLLASLIEKLKCEINDSKNHKRLKAISDMKKELFAHQETIFILSQQKEAQLKFYKTREDKEIDKVIALENKLKVLDNIVYKTGQSVQTMNMLNRNCTTSFAKPEFLKKAQRANPCMYDICCYNDNLALMLTPEFDDVIRLEKESRSKLSDLIRPFDYEKLNNLDDLFVPQRKKSSTQRYFQKEKHSISLELALQQCKEQMKNDTVCKEKASNVFRKEREQYLEIQDLKAQLQEKNIATNELKKLIEKCKGKTVETKFDKPYVVRQPNAQRIPKPLVLGKPASFLDSLERKHFTKTTLVPKTNVSEGLSKPVTTQNLPQTATQAVRNTNVIKPCMYRIDSRTTQTRAPQLPQTYMNNNPRVATSTGVTHRTNVSRPQLRSSQIKDKVVLNNSQVKDKKTKVEYHPSISSISNKTKSVTACNDSLKPRTSNVNAVYATCEKCLVDSDHFACVTKLLNDVNARTKKPNVVSISTGKP
nr:hypothetical protein [Tanacetum cinerariifolium]